LGCEQLVAASSCSLFAEGCPQGAASFELVPPAPAAGSSARSSQSGLMPDA